MVEWRSSVLTTVPFFNRSPYPSRKFLNEKWKLFYLPFLSKRGLVGGPGLVVADSMATHAEVHEVGMLMTEWLLTGLINFRYLSARQMSSHNLCKLLIMFYELLIYEWYVNFDFAHAKVQVPPVILCKVPQGTCFVRFHKVHALKIKGLVATNSPSWNPDKFSGTQVQVFKTFKVKNIKEMQKFGKKN